MDLTRLATTSTKYWRYKLTVWKRWRRSRARFCRNYRLKKKRNRTMIGHWNSWTKNMRVVSRLMLQATERQTDFHSPHKARRELRSSRNSHRLASKRRKLLIKEPKLSWLAGLRREWTLIRPWRSLLSESKMQNRSSTSWKTKCSCISHCLAFKWSLLMLSWVSLA